MICEWGAGSRAQDAYANTLPRCGGFVTNLRACRNLCFAQSTCAAISFGGGNYCYVYFADLSASPVCTSVMAGATSIESSLAYPGRAPVTKLSGSTSWKTFVRL